MCKVISGVAWRPVSQMCGMSDHWRGMVFRKSLKICLRLVDLNNNLNFAYMHA